MPQPRHSTPRTPRRLATPTRRHRAIVPAFAATLALAASTAVAQSDAPDTGDHTESRERILDEHDRIHLAPVSVDFPGGTAHEYVQRLNRSLGIHAVAALGEARFIELGPITLSGVTLRDAVYAAVFAAEPNAGLTIEGGSEALFLVPGDTPHNADGFEIQVFALPIDHGDERDEHDEHAEAAVHTIEHLQNVAGRELRVSIDHDAGIVIARGTPNAIDALERAIDILAERHEHQEEHDDDEDEREFEIEIDLGDTGLLDVLERLRPAGARQRSHAADVERLAESLADRLANHTHRTLQRSLRELERSDDPARTLRTTIERELTPAIRNALDAMREALAETDRRVGRDINAERILRLFDQRSARILERLEREIDDARSDEVEIEVEVGERDD